ncbi:MAG TPA: hypothetical protein VH331_17700 [Allosphingosinicella sp.]|nr:hypothetical protein [Allosphingosinicella sp.]
MSEDPDRGPRLGYESVPPGSGRILAGILLLMFGLCISLVGGSCTVLWLGELGANSDGWLGPLLLLVSLAVLALGIFAIVMAVRLFRGPRRRGGNNGGGMDA